MIVMASNGLSVDGGDDVIVYIMRPEDELSMDMLNRNRATSSIVNLTQARNDHSISHSIS